MSRSHWLFGWSRSDCFQSKLLLVFDKEQGLIRMIDIHQVQMCLWNKNVFDSQTTEFCALGNVCCVGIYLPSVIALVLYRLSVCDVFH